MLRVAVLLVISSVTQLFLNYRFHTSGVHHVQTLTLCASSTILVPARKWSVWSVVLRMVSSRRQMLRNAQRRSTKRGKSPRRSRFRRELPDAVSSIGLVTAVAATRDTKAARRFDASCPATMSSDPAK